MTNPPFLNSKNYSIVYKGKVDNDHSLLRTQEPYLHSIQVRGYVAIYQTYWKFGDRYLRDDTSKYSDNKIFHLPDEYYFELMEKIYTDAKIKKCEPK